MKNFYIILLSVLIFTSCSNDDNSSSNNDNEIRGLYTFEIPNCDNGENPEIHCTLSVNFVNNKEVSPISITGGDIFYETNYTINNDIIKFNKSSKFNFDMSFKRIDNLTLERIENGTIWLKDE